MYDMIYVELFTLTGIDEVAVFLRVLLNRISSSAIRDWYGGIGFLAGLK